MVDKAVDFLSNYDFFNKLCALPYVDAIFLYGSRARGDDTQDSDFDIAIVCPDANDDEWQQILRIIQQRDLLIAIDVKRFDALENGSASKRTINQTKSLLYMRPSRQHVDILKHRIENYGWLAAHTKKIMDKHAAGTLDNVHPLIKMCKENYICSYCDCRRALLCIGVRTNAPVLTFRAAWEQGWLDDHKLWEQFIDHGLVAQERLSPKIEAEIVERLPQYIDAVEKLYNHLQQLHAELSKDHTNIREKATNA